MAEATVQRPATEEAALAEIDIYCRETDRLLAEMKQGREEIERLQQESKESLARIEAMVEKLSADR